MGAIKYGPILKEMNLKLLTSLCSQVARLVLRARITVFCWSFNFPSPSPGGHLGI